MRRLVLVFALALVVPGTPFAGHASDGVLEINRECALNTGCFPGDAPGWPVTIEGFNPGNPGAPIAPSRSFRLTSDLGPLGANETAIAVNANNATIDLAGFRIFGSTARPGVPVTACSPVGSGVGVLGGSDVTVKSGTIHGMGDDGVRLDYSGLVEGVHLFHNGGDGIQLGNESIARGNIVTSNGGDGLHCFLNCVVRDNTSTGNGNDGIDLVSGTVTGNSASNNGAFGGRFAPAVTLALNQFTANASGDVSGGHGGAGNNCFDGTCSRRGQRRFYLTTSAHNGANAPTACDTGYHFASLWEIFDPTVLEYDTVKGFAVGDSASGPPSGAAGWIRTGVAANASAAVGSNCSAWSSTSGNGTVAALDTPWNDGNPVFNTDVPPWLGILGTCSSANRVWCVED